MQHQTCVRKLSSTRVLWIPLEHPMDRRITVNQALPRTDKAGIHIPAGPGSMRLTPSLDSILEFWKTQAQQDGILGSLARLLVPQSRTSGTPES